VVRGSGGNGTYPNRTVGSHDRVEHNTSWCSLVRPSLLRPDQFFSTEPAFLTGCRRQGDVQRSATPLINRCWTFRRVRSAFSNREPDRVRHLAVTTSKPGERQDPLFRVPIDCESLHLHRQAVPRDAEKPSGLGVVALSTFEGPLDQPPFELTEMPFEVEVVGVDLCVPGNVIGQNGV